MKFVRFIIITVITYSLPLSAAVGPIRNAEKEIGDFRNQVSKQIDLVRNLLTSFIQELGRQQVDAEKQKSDLITKQQLIDTSNKELVSSRQEINQNKLLPKDVKDPLNDMFNSSVDLINQMSNVVGKGIQTTQDVQKLVPDVIAKIQNVVKEIDTYAKIFKEGTAVALNALKPLAEAERIAQKAGKAIEQTAQQTGKAIEQTAQQAGKVIEQTAQQTDQAITQAAQQAVEALKQRSQQTSQNIVQAAQQVGQGFSQSSGQIGQASQQVGQTVGQSAQQTGKTIEQTAQQAGKALQQAPAKIEQGLKDFGKLLGIG